MNGLAKHPLCLVVVALGLLAAVNWSSLYDLATLAILPYYHKSTSNACSNHNYHIHIFSKRPLVIYISNFLAQHETQELTRLSDTNYNDSEIEPNEDGVIDRSIRFSKSAYPEENELLQCIETRAMAFQGFGQLTGDFESIQLVKYGPSGFYKHHHDGDAGYPRQSSFFAYVFSNGTGGGTNFPLLKRPTADAWCRYIDCNETTAKGVTFKPVVGNAIYWDNLKSSGDVYKSTLHAGLPVTSGVKIGMNIWTWRKDDAIL